VPALVRSWTATLALEPKGKGNSKTILPDRSSPKCQRCGKHERRLLVPRSQDVKAERSLAKLLRIVGPPVPFECDVELLIVFRLPIRPSWNKAKQQAAREGKLRPTSAKRATGPIPDLGQLEKLGDDALEKGGWVVNDSLICVRRSEKVYHDEPGYVIALQELP
jgi:Holliday junction resolvase RusA-like endonuclease